MVASLVSDLGQLSKSRDFEEATSKSSPAGIFSRLPLLAAMRQRFLALQNSAEIQVRKVPILLRSLANALSPACATRRIRRSAPAQSRLIVSSAGARRER